MKSPEKRFARDYSNSKIMDFQQTVLSVRKEGEKEWPRIKEKV